MDKNTETFAKQLRARGVKKAFLSAFPLTLPVLAGFLFMGTAYGILMTSVGCSPLWTFFTSLIVLAGSLQFVAITFITAAFNPLHAFVMTLMVNARHLFYGLSLLDKIGNSGKYKPYIIFALCDETFSLISSNEAPEGTDKNLFMFFIALLDHCYWVMGSVIGAILGSALPISTKGLEFALTSLIFVIFLGNLTDKIKRQSSAIGVACSILCLLLFKENFILPAMALILIVFGIISNKMVKED